MIQAIGDECASKSVRDEGDLISLPKQLWCSVKKAEDKETCCEVGWLLDQGRAITSKCIFSSTAEPKVSFFPVLVVYILGQSAVIPLFFSA